jgi:predicted nuclease of restriction endonuclease-like (RecB) superfamily
MTEIIEDNNYRNWILDLKNRIKTSQIKASLAVNSELIRLYWDIGMRINNLQINSKYGDGVIKQIAKDLKTEFSEMTGFSRSNLFAMKRFYLYYFNESVKIQQLAVLYDTTQNNPANIVDTPDNLIVQQVAGQFESADNLKKNSLENFIDYYCSKIPWWHNVVIIQKTSFVEESIFYIQQTIENNWSRSILEMQIESNLFVRQGKAVNNFHLTLPKPQSDLANALLKDPYNFNFLTLEKDVQELQLENQLIKNITQFLLELGKGFAYLGRQFPLQVGSKEYRLDLLFYHVKLKCYVVIELKTKEFEPEHIGKLNFYLSAIDSLVKSENDAPTMGMLLCKNKDNLNVEFALRDVNKPIGISEYTFSELPYQIKNAMPTVEELEKELFRNDELIKTD